MPCGRHLAEPFFRRRQQAHGVAARGDVLDLNGYDVDAEMADALQAMLSLAAGTLSEEDFAAWLRERLKNAVN